MSVVGRYCHLRATRDLRRFKGLFTDLLTFYLLCGAGLQEGLRASPRIKFPAYTCRTQLLGAGRWAEAGMARDTFEMVMNGECGNRKGTAPKRTQP